MPGTGQYAVLFCRLPVFTGYGPGNGNAANPAGAVGGIPVLGEAAGSRDATCLSVGPDGADGRDQLRLCAVREIRAVPYA